MLEASSHFSHVVFHKHTGHRRSDKSVIVRLRITPGQVDRTSAKHNATLMILFVSSCAFFLKLNRAGRPKSTGPAMQFCGCASVDIYPIAQWGNWWALSQAYKFW